MNNLGMYQNITKWSKKLGGPVNFIAVVAAGGYVVGKCAEFVVKQGSRIVGKTAEKKQTTSKNDWVYTSRAAGWCDDEVVVSVGDKFRVLGRDGEAVLIELIGKPDNPYFVSDTWLRTISDYSESD